MGVAFSHCDAQWSYSGFNDFRRRLGEMIGLNLYEYEGFYTGEELEYIRRTGEIPTGKKSWDEINDPIVGLLHHSDCDGHLTPEQCRIVAPRLRELVQSWDDTWSVNTPTEWQEIGYKPNLELPNHDKVNALKLAEGMERAAAANESLGFH